MPSCEQTIDGCVWHDNCMEDLAMSTRAKLETYLAATTKVSRVPGRVFSLSDVCDSLNWERAECDTVATQLEKAGLLNRLPNDQAILTSAGMKRMTESADE